MRPPEALRLRSLHPSDRLFLLELMLDVDETGFSGSAAPSRAAVDRLRRAGHLERVARLADGPSGLRLERGFTLRPAARSVTATAVPPSDAKSRICNAPPTDERALLDALAGGDRRAEKQLAVMHLGTAERLALRLAPSTVPRDEARAAAPEALLRALRTFDADRGAAFPTHLCWCVRSAVRDLGRLYGPESAELDVESAGRARSRHDDENIDSRVLSGFGLTTDPRQGADIDFGVLPDDLRPIALDLAEGWSPEESAERRGLSVHQVRRARTRVREALRG